MNPAPKRAPFVQRLWIPFRFDGQNEIIAKAKGFGGRGYGYSKAKEEQTGLVLMFARRLRPVARARFRFIWCEPNRQRNPDNISAGKKFVFDGLVKAKILVNDGWGEIAAWSDEFVVRPGKVGVLVEIEDVE